MCNPRSSVFMPLIHIFPCEHPSGCSQINTDSPASVQFPDLYIHKAINLNKSLLFNNNCWTTVYLCLSPWRGWLLSVGEWWDGCENLSMSLLIRKLSCLFHQVLISTLVSSRGWFWFLFLWVAYIVFGLINPKNRTMVFLGFWGAEEWCDWWILGGIFKVFLLEILPSVSRIFWGKNARKCRVMGGKIVKKQPS